MKTRTLSKERVGGLGPNEAFAWFVLTCARFNGDWVDSRDFQIRHKFVSFLLLFAFAFMISAIYSTAGRISSEVGAPGPWGPVSTCASPSASYAACLK